MEFFLHKFVSSLTLSWLSPSIRVKDSYSATFRKKDRIVLRLVVAVVCCLEFSHTMILMVTGYNVFVKRFGDVSALMGWTPGWVALPLIGSIGE